MKRNLLLIPLVAIPFVSMATKPTQKSAETKKKPNLLFIMADQWRGRALGFLGVEPVKTPNLDRLAASGVVLNQAVSGYPVSSPARAMLMSGAYPHKNGVTGNCNSNTTPQNVELRADLTCWSDVLKAEGYATGYLGKWHLDKLKTPWVNCSNNRNPIAWNEWCPPSRRHGFDYWTAYGTYDNHMRPMYWTTDATRDGFHYVDQWGPEYETDLAIEFLHSHAAKTEPFALVVSMNPPHTGYELVPDRYKELYKGLNVDSIAHSWPNVANADPDCLKFFKNSLANYYACMSGVDDQVGRMMEALKTTGELENTIVIFTSDHGDVMGIHNHIGKNIFYEEAMRIPMIISHIGTLKPRLDNKLLIAFEDLCPTMLSLMGLGSKIPSTVQTLDLSAQIAGSRKSLPPSQLYIHWTEDEGEFIEAKNGSRGLRTIRYTYSQQAKNGKIVAEFLFDRLKDPYQLTNIASISPKIIKTMRQELRSRLDKAEDDWTDNKF